MAVRLFVAHAMREIGTFEQKRVSVEIKSESQIESGHRNHFNPKKQMVTRNCACPISGLAQPSQMSCLLGCISSHRVLPEGVALRVGTTKMGTNQLVVCN